MSEAGAGGDWLVPNWPAPAGVHAICTTRNGGLSQSPYDSLNLGTHVGDAPDDVSRNRAVLQRHLAGGRAVFLEQVHGTVLQSLDLNTPHGQVADIAWTSHAGLACTIMVADCLPILLTDRAGSQVAAAHAGWRGLVGFEGQGVIEVTHRHMVDRGAKELLAWLGPCIGPTVFEVGDEVRAAFVDICPQDAQWFSAHVPGKWWADLPALARSRLARLGVANVYGNDGGVDWCTVSNPSRFFSHRRDRVSGRMAACIWRDGTA